MSGMEFLFGMIFMLVMGLGLTFVRDKQFTQWYDANCDCKKCACHRPLEECK